MPIQNTGNQVDLVPVLAVPWILDFARPVAVVLLGLGSPSPTR